MPLQIAVMAPIPGSVLDNVKCKRTLTAIRATVVLGLPERRSGLTYALGEASLTVVSISFCNTSVRL
jgi:hypothetical protein